MSYSPKILDRTLSEKIATTFTNNSGSNILALVPVSVDTSGGIRTVNVSNETNSKAVVGVTISTINNGASGDVITSGIIENVSSPFSLGDVLYVSKTGALTNVAPDIGVGGFLVADFSIRVGVIIKNKSNPLNKDLLVSALLLGQL